VELLPLKWFSSQEWSWSTCIKPVVGGESCQARHVGTILSGSMSVKHNDGIVDTFVSGDVYFI
jgi:hypothetical protein